MKISEFKTASPTIVLEALKKENPGLYAELLWSAKTQVRPLKSKEEVSKDLLESIREGRII